MQMNAPFRLKIEENVPLAPLTTLKIGGAARFFVRAENESQVVEAARFAERNSIEIFILGGGSNILVSDEGFDGLVLQIALKGISVSRKKDQTIYVKAGAGEDWDELVSFCVEKNLQGFECLSGIPGFVGGTPVQNVGAYGQEVSQTIISARVFDRKTGEILDLTNAECEFAYRTSIFNTTEKNRFIVLSVIFALKLDGKPQISYRELREVFDGKNPTLAETRKAIIEIRSAKSMVIDAKDTNSKSVGSFFKNPVVSNKEFDKICQRAKIFNIESVPKFTINERSVKIPAAWLIEKSGFHKGFVFNRAGLSTKHALAIINRGGATAREVLALKNEIQKRVKEKFNLELTPEPVFVGSF